MQTKIKILVLAAIVGLVLIIGNTAFSKPHVENAKKHLSKFNQVYVYVGDDTQAQQKDPSKYIKETSPSCTGAQVVICTITTSTDEGANPNFGAGNVDNPVDHPEDFVAVTKKPA
jgi:predicted negative regulator of RcsB-dependent stress response